MKSKRITKTYEGISKEYVMTKKRNWLGRVVLLAVVAVVAVGCDEVMGFFGFGDEEENIVPPGTNGDPDPSVVVSTIAGSGATGVYEGDLADGDGTTEAKFQHPFGVAVDGEGNVYVADSYNNRIRKISPQGVVSTLAGGLYHPYGVAVDGNYNVYVANTENNRICKISPEGEVTTLAGSDNGVGDYVDGPGKVARFCDPCGVAVDVMGNNVYVADSVNQRIRKITITP
jgi:DNA-binding beta-propeller fold protein YncE